MTKDNIIRMAREAGIAKHGLGWTCWEGQLERFAALVAAAEQKKWEDQTAVEIHEAVLEEREACAKVAENGLIGHTIAKAIRARGNT